MKQISHSYPVYGTEDNGKEFSRQNPVSIESVDASWLDRVLEAEEEELLEALAATLSSGTAYHDANTATAPSSLYSQDGAYHLQTFSTANPSDHNDNHTSMIDTPRASSSLPEESWVKSATDPDAAFDPDPIVRIIKPLPRKSLRFRFPDAVRVTKPLPKRIPKAPIFSDPETQSWVVEENPILTTTTQTSYASSDHASFLNVVEMQTLAVAEGLTTPLAPPPPPIKATENDIKCLFITTPPHIAQASALLSDPIAVTSTSMNADNQSSFPQVNLRVPFISSPSQPSSSTLSTFKNWSKATHPQMSTNEPDDDQDINALIKQFSKSHVVWVDDEPDPIPISQPTVPLQTSRRSRVRSTDNEVATPIHPAHDRSAKNMIVDLTETTDRLIKESIYELNLSNEVSQSDNMSDLNGTYQILDSITNIATLNSWPNSLRNTNNNNSNNNSLDDSSFSSRQNKTNNLDVQPSDSVNHIISTFDPNLSSTELSSFSSTFLTQFYGDATIGVEHHQTSWQQGEPQANFYNNYVPSVERYNDDLTYQVTDSSSFTSIHFDNQQSLALYSQLCAYSEADENENRSHTRLPTSIAFQGLDGTAEQFNAISTYPVEEPTIYGTLFDHQTDSWDIISQNLGFSNTNSSISFEEMIDEINESEACSAVVANTTGINDTFSIGIGQHQSAFHRDYLDIAAAPMPGHVSSAKSTPSNLPPSGNDENGIDSAIVELSESRPSTYRQHRQENISMHGSDNRLHHISSSPSNTANDAPILQPLVHLDDLGHSPVDLGDSTVSLQSLRIVVEDNSDTESLEEVQLGDDIEIDVGIVNTVVGTEFTAGRFASTESDSKSRIATIRVNGTTYPNDQSQLASMSNSELSNSVLGHSPILLPNEQEQSTFASDPVPSESGPANDINPSSKQRKTTADSIPKHSDSVSIDNSNSLNELARSESAISSVSEIFITRCDSRPPSPPIHTSPVAVTPSSGQSLSVPVGSRSPTSSSILQPVAWVPNNSDVPADFVLPCPPYIETLPTFTTRALDVVTPTAITVHQYSTTHVPRALNQNNPMSTPLDYVLFDTQNGFLSSPVTEAHAQFLYEASDIDMDTSPDPSYYLTITKTSSNVHEMWSVCRDIQQSSNKDDDPMDLMDFDDPMTSWSGLYSQSHQVDIEMASAGDWCHPEAIMEDVEMGDAILAEAEIVHEVYYEQSPSTPMAIPDDPVSFLWGEEAPPRNIAVNPSSGWSVDPSRPDFATTLEAPPVTTQIQTLATETPSLQTCPEVHKTQQEEVAEPLQFRTTEIQNATTSVAVPPMDPQLLMGSKFMHEISILLDNLNARASLELGAQAVWPIQTTTTHLVSATNGQPTAHSRVLQIPESEAPSYEPSTAELWIDTPNKDESSAVKTEDTTQSRDIDTNLHSTHLPDYGAKLNNRVSASNLKRGPKRYGRRPTVNNTPSTILPSDSGEMQVTDLDEPAILPKSFPDLPPGRHVTRTKRVCSKTKNESLSKPTTDKSPSRARRRVQFAVDIANTRVTFGTETSRPGSQSPAPSTALCVEVSPQCSATPELSISAMPQLDKTVETRGFWASLWGALMSLF